MNYIQILILLMVLISSPFHAIAQENPPPYTVIARYRIANITHLSGVAILGRQKTAAGESAVAAILSDKEPAVYRLVIPLRAVDPVHDIVLKAEKSYRLKGASDCEDISWDSVGRRLYVVCEQHIGGPSRLYIVPVDTPANIHSFALDSIFNDYNTGAEACALIPGERGMELWVGKERFKPPLSIPPVYRYLVRKGRLSYVGRVHLNVSLHRTQSGMAYNPLDDRLWIISRELRYLFACRVHPLPSGGLLSADTLSFGYRWDTEYGYPPPLGMVEGIAFDRQGFMYIACDNNDEPIGLAGTKKKKDPLLLVLRPR